MSEPRYVLDDAPEDAFTLDAFLADNEDLDDAELLAVRALAPGEHFTSGGGAAARWTITRLPEEGWCDETDERDRSC